MVLAGQDAPGLHEVEDLVPTDDDLAVLGNADQRVRRRTRLVGRDLDRAPDGRALDEVVLRRRLGNRGKDGDLGQGEVLELLVEVALRGRRDAIALVAVEVLVEIGGDDPLLAVLAGVRLGQPDRLDDLPDLPLIGRAGESRLGQEAGPNELLGDRGPPTRPALERVHGGRDEAAEVEAGIAPEILVLDRRGGVQELGRDLVEGHDLALAFAKAGQLHGPGPVVDDRGLVEAQKVEGLLRIGQVTTVDGIGADDADEGDGTEGNEAPEEEHREGQGDSASGAATPASSRGAVAAMALPPGEAGLHDSGDDTIGAVEDLSADPACLVTARPSTL